MSFERDEPTPGPLFSHVRSLAKRLGLDISHINNNQIVEAIWLVAGRSDRKDYEPAGRKSSGITAPPCRGEALHSAGEPVKELVGVRPGTATPGMKQGHGGSHAAPAVNVDLSRGVAVGLTGERAIINLAPSDGNSTDEPQDEGSTDPSSPLVEDLVLPLPACDSTVS